MANTINTLYSDSAKTNAIYPRTKFKAVSDDNGNVLGNIGVLNYTEQASGVDAVKIDSFSSVDTGRMLYYCNAYNDAMSAPYVATEDCWAIGGTNGNFNSVKINGIEIYKMEYTSGNVSTGMTIPLKKGDSIQCSCTANGGLAIYGVKK